MCFYQVEQKESDEEMESTPATEIKLPRGSVIHFSGVCKTCVREDIKERLEQLNAEIAYIDFQRGDEKGWIRLQGENAAKPVVDKMEEGKVRNVYKTFRANQRDCRLRIYSLKPKY